MKPYEVQLLKDPNLYLSRRGIDRGPSSYSGPTALLQAYNLMSMSKGGPSYFYTTPETIMKVFIEWLESPEADALVRNKEQLQSWFLGVANRQSPLILSQLFNIYLEKNVTKFSTLVDLKSTLMNLVDGHPTVVRLNSVLDGQWVTVSGFRSQQEAFLGEDKIDLSKLDCLYIIDSYGNPLKNYYPKNGSRVELTPHDWQNLVHGTEEPKSTGRKWGFLF